MFYGCNNERFGGSGSVLRVHDTTWGTRWCELPAHGPVACSDGDGEGEGAIEELRCSGGHGAEAAVELLRDFYKQTNPNAPVPRPKHGR